MEIRLKKDTHCERYLSGFGTVDAVHCPVVGILVMDADSPLKLGDVSLALNQIQGLSFATRLLLRRRLSEVQNGLSH